MRTLKKTLSLVLVVAMVLGLCVVGASAKDKVESFTDDYQKVGAAYQEAVGVLVGVGIIDGMTETALEPQGNYTREQAAKIIAYMLLGKSKADSLKCTVAPFDDVAASRWSAGYIAFCVEQGIIDGMTATTYEPTGTLTGFQWAKMLLCAIGFGVKGEFTGSSWSVNTALVAHKVNLFAGDLDGADHTALRREQAALYAFNALNTAKVAYSPNVTSYVFGIEGYTTVNGIGSTLAKDVYDLKYAQGIIVDAEGMGAGYTVVSKDYSTANVTNKIKADNDIDMMYHAARVWYTGTNTGVYTYDLAKTTAYQCREIPTGDKAATSAKATGKTIGTGTAYEAYLVDNSAISAGSAYVTVKAEYGSMGYVDAAKKTTSVVGAITYTVPSANVRTDVSAIKYNAPVVFIYTTSNTDNTAHGLYVYAATSTVGTVKTITQDSGKVISITLADGTVLKVSSLADTYKNMNKVEKYVIGNVYTFVLDSHGHIVYATKDYARSLWAFTGEYRATGNYGDINTDQGREYRFYNVSTGEEKFFPVTFYGANGNEITWNNVDTGYGEYFDISATPGANGLYVAKQITAETDNTYAAGYIVDTATFKLGQNDEWYWDSNKEGIDKVYFNGETVTFLVATGTGANMKVNSYTGIAGLKEAFAVAANGTVTLRNAAFTVTSTITNNWNASVIFVMAANIATESNYVFIPNDVLANQWTEVIGGPDGYYQVVYGNVAYLEGAPFSIIFQERNLINGKLVRGFYTLKVTYDRNGNPYYALDQKIDNGWRELCYFQNVTFAYTGVNNTWKFYSTLTPNKTFTAVEGTTKVVDFTGNGIDTIEKLWANKDWYDLEFAFTVDPNTKTVDYVYVTNPGWDAQYNISLSAEMQAAGWVFKDGDKTSTSVSLNDDAAWAASKAGKTTVTLYNKTFAEKSTTYSYKVGYYESGDVAADLVPGSTMDKGVVTAELPLTALNNTTAKTRNYVVCALNNEKAIDFKVGTNSSGTDLNQYYEIEKVSVPTGSSLKDNEFIFGTPVTVTVKITQTVPQKYVELTFSSEFKDRGVADIVVKVPTEVTSVYQTVTFTVYPMASGTYTLTGATWA